MIWQQKEKLKILQEHLANINKTKMKNTPIDLNTGICITCKYFIEEESGFEFENILDTEYAIFKCQKLGKKSRDDFLMAPIPDEIEIPKLDKCPYWEFWDKEM